MSNVTIDLPEIRFEGVFQSGILYFSATDVIAWLLACAAVARAHDIPIEVEQYVGGIAAAVERAEART